MIICSNTYKLLKEYSKRQAQPFYLFKNIANKFLSNTDSIFILEISRYITIEIVIDGNLYIKLSEYIYQTLILILLANMKIISIIQIYYNLL